MTDRYIWRGKSFNNKQEFVHHISEAHAAEHVTVGTSEMHVTLDNGVTLIYDMSTTFGIPVTEIEVCDSYKMKYAS